MKSLAILENQLLELQRARDRARSTILPSAQDSALDDLKQRSSWALGSGGLERVLDLVQKAKLRGEF